MKNNPYNLKPGAYGALCAITSLGAAVIFMVAIYAFITSLDGTSKGVTVSGVRFLLIATVAVLLARAHYALKSVSNTFTNSLDEVMYILLTGTHWGPIGGLIIYIVVVGLWVFMVPLALLICFFVYGIPFIWSCMKNK